jgi:hypothetical protein
MSGTVKWRWLTWGRLDKVEGLLKTVDFFYKFISDSYAHFQVKAANNARSFCMFWYILQFTVQFN